LAKAGELTPWAALAVARELKRKALQAQEKAKEVVRPVRKALEAKGKAKEVVKWYLPFLFLAKMIIGARLIVATKSSTAQ
jgi:hypothetical protein